MGKLIGPGAILLLYLAIIVYSFMKRRNKGNDKPQEHPCEYCLRWEECNGVDADICPLIKK